MTLRNTKPLRFSPAGLSDSLDETDEFPGACAILQNLIPDPSTKNVWTCRPASIPVSSFPGFTTPGFVSVFKVIGSFVFGMIASGRNPNFDEPFCFNILTNQFVTVAGITATNVPSSLPSTGDWTPPTMALVGIFLIVTHAGFGASTTWSSATWDVSVWDSGGGSGSFGWFDISNAARPSWHASNLQQGGSIQSISVLNAGSLYANGTYTSVPLTGGTGSGATADIVVAGGGVSAIYLGTWGKGYTAGDTLSASNTNLGGAGSGFTATVNAVALNGAIQFTTPPTWVAQFFERAYFGVNPPNGVPSVVFTDVLSLNVTNATQALTFDSNLPLVAGHGLGLSNQLGGVIQSLMVFQDDENIIQITGDAALSTLSVNSLNTAVGTIAPRSVVSTPNGVMFLAYDGFRFINFDASVTEPVGEGGTGLIVPFEQALNPTRINSACNGGTMRVSVIRGDVLGNPWQEFWYDLKRKRWSGPHTFPSSIMDVYGAEFILAPANVQATLYSSAVFPTPSSTFVEHGTLITWIFQSVVLTANEQMCENEIAEMTVNIGVPLGSNTYTVTILDENAISLGYGTVALTENRSPTVAVAMFPYLCSFSGPVIYTRAAVEISGSAGLGFRLGDIFIRRRALGYVQFVTS